MMTLPPDAPAEAGEPHGTGSHPAKPCVNWPDAPQPASGPLDGVKILDLTTVIMGSSATQLLGDLGANVIKIEPPPGDTMRWIGPWHHPGMGPLYRQANRIKRSIVPDLKNLDGKAAALALAAEG